jgi:hypothetical protein
MRIFSVHLQNQKEQSADLNATTPPPREFLANDFDDIPDQKSKLETPLKSATNGTSQTYILQNIQPYKSYDFLNVKDDGEDDEELCSPTKSKVSTTEVTTTTTHDSQLNDDAESTTVNEWW